MRPTRLELKGFSAFRETTIIDFAELDLFALTGPTGSGKSSIIDGIGFALYGSVARYRKTNLVAPIINQLATEARVRLDFDVNGTSYAAVRVVRRTESGATTKEARLESGDDVLAGNARELDAAVEGLLGLDFHQFTKTVVLPQGEFARFLTESPSDRQALLRRLLGMEQYRRVASAARDRAKTSLAQAEALREQLTGAHNVSKADLREAEKKRNRLQKIEEKVRVAAEERAEADEKHRQAADMLATVDQQLETLADLEVPEDVASFVQRRTAADDAVATSEAAAEKARSAYDAAVAKAESTEDTDELEHLLDLHDRRTEARATAKDAATEHAAATKRLEKFLGAAEAAREQLTAAENDRNDARIRAGAAGLVDQLRSGEPCPVCQQIVDAIPTHDPIADLAEFDARLTSAKEAVAEAATACSDSTTEVARAEDAREAAESDLAALTDELDGVPPPGELKKRLVRATKAADAAEVALTASEDAEAAAAEARHTRAELDDDLSEMRRTFTAARDTVADHGPPAPGGDDIALDWASLVAFGAAATKALRTNRTEAAATERTAAKRVAASDRTIARALAPVLDEPATSEPSIPEDPVLFIVTETARAVAAHETMQERLELATSANQRIEELEADHRVASELGRLVGATGFEQWLMTDVMADLAARATIRLHGLSQGAYSLVTLGDGTDFAIRDHRNADEVRAARTLSGGETFLASLALALALAESITELAADGVAPLDSMFLDEGFGTLDGETLDVVAAAVEELGASGRMVGIVTHIPELAERVPVRLKVSKSPAGSAVVRD